MNKMSNFLTVLPMVAMLGLGLSNTTSELGKVPSNNVSSEIKTDANQNSKDLSSSALAFNDIKKSDVKKKKSSCTGTCTGTCDGGCKGCSTTCSGTCDGSCKSTCSTTCSGTCDGSCKSTCSTSNKS